MVERLWLWLLLGCLPAGCASGSGAAARPARINHVVLFKLHDPAEASALIRACDARLPALRGVVAYAAGRHLETGRDVVDGDYDVALYLGFEHEADYDAYLEHPDHLALVTAWRPRLAWMRVHDVLDETP